MAACQSNLEMVKYCVAKKCPINVLACESAAKNGHLECLKYLREEVKAPWDAGTGIWAAENGHLHILEYLIERKYDEYGVVFGDACKYAAEKGHLDCLKYLHETTKRLGTRTPFEKRTRTTESSVYNITSTTTVHYHMVGDTKTASYTVHKNTKTNKTSCTNRIRERERKTVKE